MYTSSFALLFASAAVSLPHVECAAPKISYPSASSWFAGWHATEGFPVSAISWDKYTDVTYAFAVPTANGSLSLEGSNPDQLPVFVAAAKKHKVKALVSLGGWAGGRFFSTAVGSAKNRTAFVKTCIDFVKKYKLDGLDLDWEYPNNVGAGCNTMNKNDVANFLLFLQELRKEGGTKLMLTAAASLLPWSDASGSPAKNLAGFNAVLDRVVIMNYDIYGPWANTAGPNAPLGSTCDSRNSQGGADVGVKAWLAAGISPHKLVLGVPYYGHGFSVSHTAAINKDGSLNMFPSFNSSAHPIGDRWDIPSNGEPDVCGNPTPIGGSGSFDFFGLMEAGFLDHTGRPAAGILHGFDNCSKTPAVYNKISNIWVSYDDAQSMAAKGQFILQHGLGGFAAWETGGDKNNILVNAIRKAVGLR